MLSADAKKDGRCEANVGDAERSRARAQPRCRRSLRRTARLPAAYFLHYGLRFPIDGQVQSAQIFADDSKDQELYAGKQKNRSH